MSENLYFWTEFNKVVLEKGNHLIFVSHILMLGMMWRLVQVKPKYQLGISKKHIIVELYINNSKELFDKLFSQKDEIEKELGFKMQWKRLDDMKASRIQYFIKGLDFDNKDNYPDLMSKIIEKVVVLKNVFPKYI